MKFKEFVNSEEELFIHCCDENQAEIVCNALRKSGKTWKSGDTYEDTFYGVYKGYSCYSNKGFLANYNDKSSLQIKVVEFKKIEW